LRFCTEKKVNQYSILNVIMKEKGCHLYIDLYLKALFITGMSYLVFRFSFSSILELLTVLNQVG